MIGIRCVGFGPPPGPLGLGAFGEKRTADVETVRRGRGVRRGSRGGSAGMGSHLVTGTCVCVPPWALRWWVGL